MGCKWIKPLADTVLKEFERFKLKGGKAGNERIKLQINIDDETDLLDIILPINHKDIGKQQKNNKNNIELNENLSDQITLMDYMIFSSIEARECIGQSWKKKNNKKLAPHILGMIQQFNNLTVFIQIHILREKTLSQRS